MYPRLKHLPFQLGAHLLLPPFSMFHDLRYDDDHYDSEAREQVVRCPSDPGTPYVGIEKLDDELPGICRPLTAFGDGSYCLSPMSLPQLEIDYDEAQIDVSNPYWDCRYYNTDEPDFYGSPSDSECDHIAPPIPSTIHPSSEPSILFSSSFTTPSSIDQDYISLSRSSPRELSNIDTRDVSLLTPGLSPSLTVPSAFSTPSSVTPPPLANEKLPSEDKSTIPRYQGRSSITTVMLDQSSCEMHDSSSKTTRSSHRKEFRHSPYPPVVSLRRTRSPDESHSARSPSASSCISEHSAASSASSLPFADNYRGAPPGIYGTFSPATWSSSSRELSPPSDDATAPVSERLVDVTHRGDLSYQDAAYRRPGRHHSSPATPYDTPVDDLAQYSISRTSDRGSTRPPLCTCTSVHSSASRSPGQSSPSTSTLALPDSPPVASGSTTRIIPGKIGRNNGKSKDGRVPIPPFKKGGKTRYACPHPQCSQDFSRRNDVYRHLEMKHGTGAGTAYVCVCGRRLSRGDALARHRRTCTWEQEQRQGQGQGQGQGRVAYSGRGQGMLDEDTEGEEAEDEEDELEED